MNFGSEYIVARDPYGMAGGLSEIGRWRYRREQGDWRVHVEVANICHGEPWDGAMSGVAVCDDFGVLRVVGGLS